MRVTEAHAASLVCQQIPPGPTEADNYIADYVFYDYVRKGNKCNFLIITVIKEALQLVGDAFLMV